MNFDRIIFFLLGIVMKSYLLVAFQLSDQSYSNPLLQAPQQQPSFYHNQFYRATSKITKHLTLRKKAASFPSSSSSTALYYVPPEVGPEIYIGAIAGVIPFIWATIQFSGRIRTQQQCAVCEGSGLVKITKNGIALDRYRKCWNCGGLLPWLGWKMFFISSLKDIGNGGILQQPAKDYEETNQIFRNQKKKEEIREKENH